MATSPKTPEPITSAGQQIVETYKLLEQVLSYLPPKGLIVVQRVSRQFNSLINNSSLLQKKILLPLDNTKPSYSHFAHPLLPKAISSCFSWKIFSMYGKPSVWSIELSVQPHELEKALEAGPQSWQKLLLCRSTTTMVKHPRTCSTDKENPDAWVSLPTVTLNSDKGVTFGQLIDWAWEGRRHHRSWYGIRDFRIRVDATGRPVEQE